MCLNPITIKDPSNSRRSYKVPCGHCIECKRRYQTGWCLRLDEHLKKVKGQAVFFTLTYAPETIPKNYLVSGIVYKTLSDYAYDKGSVYQCLDDRTGDLIDLTGKSIIDYNSFDREQMAMFYNDQRLSINRENPDRIYSFNSVRMKDVQDWLKRCRKNFKKYCKKDIKYFITSEYGPTTFRPHYHGVMFGLTLDEFKQYFKQDWVKHYGREKNKNICVIADTVNASKNGMEYVTKYCSKGVFEHPLCTKDFFYFHKNSDGSVRHTEYHSQHYERCIEFFDYDGPLVDRPSKFISQGLGSSFLDRKELMNYYAAGDDVNLSDEIRFVYQELSDDAVKYLNLKSYECDSSGNLYHNDEKRTPVPHIVRKSDGKYYAKSYMLNNEPIWHETHCWEGWYYSDKLYERLKDISKKLRFNKNGKTKDSGDKVFSYALPQYYRKKMFDVEIQHLLSCAVLEEHVDLYQEQCRQVQSEHPTWSDFEVYSYIECQEKQQRDLKSEQLSDRLIKAYTKSVL